MKIVAGKWSNWSGSVVCRPRSVVRPKDDLELAAAVRQAEGGVRFAGTGHSFTPLSHCSDTLIDLSAFVGLNGFDPEREVATIGAATPMWGLGSLLHPLGYALKNMSDIDRQTLGGAVATGTHGTGRTLGSLSSDVASFRLLLGTGEVVHCGPDENAELYQAGRVSLGLFGPMTEIDMRVRPVYKLQRKYFLHSSERLFGQLEGLVAANRHFEFFWFPYSDWTVCKSLNETDAHAPARHSARTLAARGDIRRPREYIFAGGAELLRYAPGLARPVNRFLTGFMPRSQKVRWSHEIYPSPRTVKFNQMEYAIPYEMGAGVVQELVAAIRKKKIATGFPIEFRTVAADDCWLSPFYGRDSVAVSVHQYAKQDAKPLFDLCEPILKAYGGRPHWAKIHSCTRDEMANLFPKFEDFRALRAKLDPKGKFLNDYLRGFFG